MSVVTILTHTDKIAYTLYSDQTAVVGNISKLTVPSAVTSCDLIADKEITIPSYIDYDNNQYTVTYLGNNAFKNCHISSIKFPDTLRHIGFSAIDLCWTESKIIIPNNIESIDSWAFASNSMTEWNIPRNVKFIGQGVFSYNKNLQTITVDSKNQYFKVYDGILYDIQMKKLIQAPASLSTITIPDSVNEIYSAAFTHCSIKELIIPVSVKKIHQGLFSFCHELKYVYILGNIIPVEDYSYFVDVELLQFNYSGSLIINTNIFVNNIPQIISVCQGYQGESLSNHSIIFNQYCHSYPLEKTILCQQYNNIHLYLIFINLISIFLT